MFNALQYTKSLEESGFQRDQAEILVRMFMQMIEFNMVTKSDFERYKSESKSDFEKYKSESKSDFEKFKSEVYHRFDSLEHTFDYKLNRLSLQLTIKLGAMLALSVGLLSTILAMKL